MADSNVVIIVDAVSFSTCVDIAVARGATVYPCGTRGDAAEVARQLGATLVGGADGALPFSASAMLGVRAGTRLVLASPNGGALAAALVPRPLGEVRAEALTGDEGAEGPRPNPLRKGEGALIPRPVGGASGGSTWRRLAARLRRGAEDALPNPVSRGEGVPDPLPQGEGTEPVVLAGCLRNARAVAAAAARIGQRIAVIPAGERWPADDIGDHSLRPAAEDLIGAGAIIDALPGRRSAEAEVAVAAFRAMRDRLPAVLEACSSGREHVLRGTAADVALAAQLNASDFAPRLVAGGFVAGASGAA